MRILFVGEFWQGSCARSLCEGLVRQGVVIEEVHETMFFPKWQNLLLRAFLRLQNVLIRHDIEAEILWKLRQMGQAVVVVYKGAQISVDIINKIKRTGSYTINVYPDCSPFAHGEVLKKALGKYDLVVSTKPWHPAAWRTLFGYENLCRFLPQGYDPALHFQEIDEQQEQPVDVLLVATYRKEYGAIIQGLTRETDLHDYNIRIHGAGWQSAGIEIPANWQLGPPIHGHAYREMVSRAKVCIAPVTREVIIDGKQYPGDEDSTRTYELPAMGAFFIHRRTDYLKQIFDEQTEVPMFDTPEELAGHIRTALKNPAQRLAMRRASQQRCVNSYSLDRRAADLLQIIEKEILQPSK